MRDGRDRGIRGRLQHQKTHFPFVQASPISEQREKHGHNLSGLTRFCAIHELTKSLEHRNELASLVFAKVNVI